MASKTRKVSFYRLSLEKQTPLPGTRTVRVTQLNNNEMEDCFRKIYNEKMQVLSDNHKAINITASNGHYVIEVISFEEHRAFLKIGQQNPANTVALRDRTTLERPLKTMMWVVRLTRSWLRMLHQKRKTASAVFLFWVPAACGRLHPSVI